MEWDGWDGTAGNGTRWDGIGGLIILTNGGVVSGQMRRDGIGLNEADMRQGTERAERDGTEPAETE